MMQDIEKLKEKIKELQTENKALKTAFLNIKSDINDLPCGISRFHETYVKKKKVFEIIDEHFNNI